MLCFFFFYKVGIGLLVIRNLISIILGVLWVILLFSKLVFWHYMQPRNVDAIMLMQTESREIYFFFGNLFVVNRTLWTVVYN